MFDNWFIAKINPKIRILVDFLTLRLKCIGNETSNHYFSISTILFQIYPDGTKIGSKPVAR